MRCCTNDRKTKKFISYDKPKCWPADNVYVERIIDNKSQYIKSNFNIKIYSKK